MKKVVVRTPSSDRREIELFEASDIPSVPTISWAAVGSTPNDYGATAELAANNWTLTLQPASSTKPGVVTTGTQSFAGDKTFTGSIVVTGNITTSAGTINGATGQFGTLGVNSGEITYPVSASVSAAGTTQASSTLVTQEIGIVTAAGGSSRGIQLTTLANGQKQVIVNNTSQQLDVYPPSGWSIDDLAADAPSQVGAGSIVEFYRAGSSHIKSSANIGFSFANIGSSPNAQGASISGNTVTLQPTNGTYGGVVSTGNQTFAGDKTFTGAITVTNLYATNIYGATDLTLNGTTTLTVSTANRITYSNANNITAHAGGGQGSATDLGAKEVNFVTTVASSGDSVRLPSGVIGQKLVIFNLGANAMDIFPASGGQINALGTNNAYSLASGSSIEVYAQSSTQWRTR